LCIACIAFVACFALDRDQAVSFTVCLCTYVCSWLESLQRKKRHHRKLSAGAVQHDDFTSSHSATAALFNTLLYDSLLLTHNTDPEHQDNKCSTSAMTVGNSRSHDAQDDSCSTSVMMTGKPCHSAFSSSSLTSLFLSAQQLAAESVSNTNSASSDSMAAGVLPLPVQDMNTEIMQQSADALMESNSILIDSNGASASRDGDVVGACSSLCFSDVISSHPVISDIPPQLCTEAATNLPTSQRPTSLHGRPAQTSTNALQCQNSSVPVHRGQRQSAAAAPNGLVVPLVVKTSAGTPVVIKTSASACTLVGILGTPLVATSRTTLASFSSDNVHQSSARTRTRPSGQFVHLTIPPTLNLTGTNIQIRQFVSVPQHTVLASRGVPNQACSQTDSGVYLVGGVACGSSQATEEATDNTSPSFDDSSLPTHTVLPGPVQLQQQSGVSDKSLLRFEQTSLLELSSRRPSSSSSDKMSTSSSLLSTDSGGRHVRGTAVIEEVRSVCSTPPACHDETSRLDSTTSACDLDILSVVHASVIPDIPTPDPSCSSQE